ncbi:MAG: SRPBCC family protein [Ruminococcaceae bacterium]|nr:SRPBCC family protein [Oscillospiraceae bacterium]
MAVSNIKAELSADIEKVWTLITSFDGAWRSDLRGIERLDEKNFVEVDKSGFKTHFTITVFEPYLLYEFDIDNDNISGHWTGKLSAKNGRTAIDFTEYITPKKLIMRPFVKGYLKKQQAAYLRDLRKALGE